MTLKSVFNTGSCNALICETGDDDDPTCVFSSLRSRVDICSQLGETYFILVHGFGASTGNFELSVSCRPFYSNDDVCNAQPLMIDIPMDFSLACATAQPGEVSPGPGTGPGGTCNAQKRLVWVRNKCAKIIMVYFHCSGSMRVCEYLGWPG